MQNIILILALAVLASCSQKRDIMNYTKVFQVSLGDQEGEIGSNLPVLAGFTNRRGLPVSMLLDVPQPYIEENKVYFADTYNKKIEVFHLDGRRLFTIANSNAQYQFARPYLVYADRTENIYVAASDKDNEAFEVQHYSNQNMPDRDLQAFQNNLRQISPYNYYLYKFSPRGEFLARFGFTSSDPMPFPLRLEGDSLGNIYVYFSEETTDGPSGLFLRRYSRSGELNFEFNTRNIKLETNVNGVHYRGNTASVHSLINDEQLLVMVEFQPTTNTRGEEVPIEVENVFSTLFVYSILENDFTRTVASFRGITPGVLGADAKGRVYYQNYEEESDTLRIITSPIDGPALGSTNYVPLNSSYYILNPYFIDSQGSLYNTLIDRQTRYFILQWKAR